ncbi:hypothetical protein CDAR_120781 [Caerostris darwini]|uniref:Uncharacterized protein n=1 Tax=Caerostris darwini TaxID=1538125 RepID=A0AAV4RW31_9ARAC|nr:hypothetical protein CDAR_120781 [Caerostris darwini]
MPVVVLRVIPNSLDESSPVIGWKIRPSTSVSVVRTRSLITLHRGGGREGTIQPPLWLKEHTSLRSPFGALRLKFLNTSSKQIPAEKSHKRKSLQGREKNKCHLANGRSRLESHSNHIRRVFSSDRLEDPSFH